MPFKKGMKAWNQDKPLAGRKGYPAEVIEGKVTKVEHKKREVSDNIHLIGNKATRMLDKAIKEGLKNESDLNALSEDIYHVLKLEGWDKAKLGRAYKLLEKCNNIAKQELAVRAASFVVDKLVPDKIEPRRAEGAESAEELRKSLFGFLKGLGGSGKKRAAFIVETDGQTVKGIAGDRGHEIPEGTEPVDNTVGGLESSAPDRLLRTGGETPGRVPQEPEETPSIVRSEPDGKDINDNRGGSGLVGPGEASVPG